MVHKVKGSITVFLSFVLVMILALIGTLLDVARIDMADSFSYRALVSAVDTEFTKYCSELYEDYHIYMLGNGHNVSEISGEEFITSISEYLMYTFDADSDLGVLGSSLKIQGTDLLDLTMDNCKVENTVALSDYDAKIFQDQVAQYMKYYVAGNAADGILEKLKLMKQSGDTMTVVRKKNEVDEAVSKVDKSIMKLMQEVEGITFKNSTLVVTDQYTIKVQDSFAKQFYTGKLSSVASTINHNVVWDSLKGSYINPVEELNKIQKDIEGYKSSSSSITSLTEKIKDLDTKISEAQLKLLQQPVETVAPTPDPGSTEEPAEENEERKKEEEELKKLEKEREQAKKELDKQKKQLSPLLKNIRKTSQKLYKSAANVHRHTEKAMDYIDEVKDAKKSSLSMLNEFETTLSDYKSKIPSDAYSGVKEEYDETKDYIQKLDQNGNDSSVVGNVLDMKETLKTNKTILENTVKTMAEGIKVSVEDLNNLESLIKQLSNQYASYSIKKLRFDYSTLQVNEKTESPLDSFGSLIEGGILELIVDDTSSLSTATMDTKGLVSASTSAGATDTEAEQKNNEDLAGKLKEPDSDGQTGISENLEKYEDNCNSATIEGSTANDLMRKFLINEYGVTNFINLMDDISADVAEKTSTSDSSGKTLEKKVSLTKEEEKDQKDEKNQKDEKQEKATKLKYEQEYLVIGGVNDLNNAKSIIMRTLFMRTAVNYISLLTNSKCRKQAKATAIGLVGFTGFAPLIAITQQLILIAWGFEEGLVDSRIMLDGSDVPFLKKAKEFSVQYTDLLKISKQTIKKKAKQQEGKKTGLGSVNYNDYLRLYMLMVPQDTLSYRMMDLIQANMRLRYDSQFSMVNGIFGTKVSMDVTMPGKFLSIPFIKDFADYDGSNITLHISTEYSY